MKEKILSLLLHYANRTRFDKKIVRFYDIKNMLLSKYGIFERYDLQFIEGKKCFSCNGTGIYSDWFGKDDICYNCYSGWYKRPFWSLLEVIRFGKYTFHRPKKKLYKKPEDLQVNIEGYIQHKEPKYGFIAMLIILFLYDKKSMKIYFNVELSNGWRLQWWKPYNFILNTFHLIKRKHKSIPIIRFRNSIANKIKAKHNPYYYKDENEELPF